MKIPRAATRRVCEQLWDLRVSASLPAQIDHTGVVNLGPSSGKTFLTAPR